MISVRQLRHVFKIHLGFFVKFKFKFSWSVLVPGTCVFEIHFYGS